jgi:hypothetical protein
VGEKISLDSDGKAMGCRWSSTIQKRMRILPCFQSRCKIEFGSWPWLSRLEDLRVRILCYWKMCGSYQWEFMVIFCHYRRTKSNLGRKMSYHLTISYISHFHNH